MEISLHFTYEVQSTCDLGRVAEPGLILWSPDPRSRISGVMRAGILKEVGLHLLLKHVWLSVSKDETRRGGHSRQKELIDESGWIGKLRLCLVIWFVVQEKTEAVRSRSIRNGLRPGCGGTGCSLRKKLQTKSSRTGWWMYSCLYCIDSHGEFCLVWF